MFFYPLYVPFWLLLNVIISSYLWIHTAEQSPVIGRISLRDLWLFLDLVDSKLQMFVSHLPKREYLGLVLTFLCVGGERDGAGGWFVHFARTEACCS